MSGAPVPRPDTTGPKPWYRNVWVLATLSGIVTITLLRPCLRHVPDPPPAGAALPEWRLTAADGSPIGSAALAGSVYVIGAYDHGEASDALLAALAKLQVRYRDARAPIRVVALYAGAGDPGRVAADAASHGADATRWTFASGPPAAVAALVTGLAAAAGKSAARPAELGLAIVDGDGRTRGLYATSDLGVDEVFHRSLTVQKQLERAR